MSNPDGADEDIPDDDRGKDNRSKAAGDVEFCVVEEPVVECEKAGPL